jgi:hypothetical protein
MLKVETNAPAAMFISESSVELRRGTVLTFLMVTPVLLHSV